MAEDDIVLCHVNDITSGTTRGFDPTGTGEATIFALCEGYDIKVYRNICPHEYRPLGLRKDVFLSGDGLSIMCYAHGARFHKMTGYCYHGPCEGRHLTPVPYYIDSSGYLRIGATHIDMPPMLINPDPGDLGKSPIKVRVEHLYYETPDVLSVRLAPSGPAALPPFEAGAHIRVQLGAALIRTYSLINGPHMTDHYQIGILLSPSQPSSLALRRLKVGSELVISTPINDFSLATNAKRHILLAGGIGITPLMSMAADLNQKGKPFELHYASKSRTRCAFRNTLAQSAFSHHTCFYFSEDGPSARMNFDILLAERGPNTHLYVCGPTAFVQHALRVAGTFGWSDERCHKETF